MPRGTRLGTLGSTSNNSDSASAGRLGLVGVDAWSIGCVDVRFSGDADRGVRGDDPGSETVGLMGVWKVGESRDGDGEGVRVGGPGCSSERG